MTSATITAGPTGATLYTDRVQSAIRRIAFNISAKTGGAVDADELFSAGEYEVAMKLDTYDAAKCSGSFRAWACQRAKWAMQDYLRGLDTLTRDERAKQKASGETFNPIVHIEACHDGYADTIGETEADRGEQGDGLRRALALIGCLPERSQAMVRQHYIEGRPVAVIAKASGCSEGTVRNTLRAALKSLRAAMERTEDRK